MGQLDGRVALVTGAARGQGEAEARLFAREGATVVCADVLDDVGQAVADDIDGAIYVHLDVTDQAQWEAAVKAAVALGPLQVLVNNAGIRYAGTVEDTPLEDYLHVINVNQVSVFLGMKSVIAPMRAAGKGSIINTSSVAGVAPKNGLVAYAATKWAIRGMSRVAAVELGQFGIRVNTIVPGTIDTPMVSVHADTFAQVTAEWPIPRLGSAEEVADLALFLASDRSSYCNGADFLIDGGRMGGSVAQTLPGAREI